MLDSFPGFGCKHGKCSKNHPFLYKVDLGNDVFAFRQSKCVTPEAPILYLVIGQKRALLIDSGDRLQDDELLHMLDSLLQEGKDLLVVHSHPHSDHTRGDEMLKRRNRTTVIIGPVSGVIDLGERDVEVVSAGSGHSAWDLCFLDLKSKLLFVGDVLYPGYLFIRRYEEYKQGIINLRSRVKGRYDWSFGSHCEMSREGDLYESGCLYQPNEAPIAQNPQVLEDLVSTLKQPKSFMNSKFVLTAVAKL